jgi:hypothetical protein
MHVKIEPTGCKLRKGRIKVRADFYLDPTDARYNERHIQVPAEQKWIDVPFLCHLFYVDDDATDKDILDQAEMYAKRAYAQWEKSKPIEMPSNMMVKPLELTPERLAKCKAKLAHLQETAPERTDIKIIMEKL